MDHGIDESDPFGVGALFVSQSMAHRFDCAEAVDQLLGELLGLTIPLVPDVPAVEVVTPIDELLDRIEVQPGLLELVEALLELGAHSPPTTPTAGRLYRAVLWVMTRHAPTEIIPQVLTMLGEATPGARFQSTDWPRQEFFALVMLLVYLGDERARIELDELERAARDLEYHDLTPVLGWYLDHHPEVPSRPSR